MSFVRDVGPLCRSHLPNTGEQPKTGQGMIVFRVLSYCLRQAARLTKSFPALRPAVSSLVLNRLAHNSALYDENADSSSASAEATEGDDAAPNSDDDDDEQGDIMTKAMRLLEEDCRKLRVEKWVYMYTLYRLGLLGPILSWLVTASLVSVVKWMWVSPHNLPPASADHSLGLCVVAPGSSVLCCTLTTAPCIWCMKY